ncbi:HU family DNA-binding protein [bacterium]|nr:HU family DNA-binding protein [bacterium]
MKKKDLVEILAKKTGLSKRIAEESLNVILDEIIKALSQGRSVILPGFGKFEVKILKERTGINPKTKEKIKLSEIKVPRFKPGKSFKEQVR